MTKFYMCSFSKSWADEFDVEGSRVMTQIQKDELVNSFEKYPNATVSVEFGTNEGWEEEPLEDFVYAYTFVELTEPTYKELKRKFPRGFGTFINALQHLDD